MRDVARRLQKLEEKVPEPLWTERLIVLMENRSEATDALLAAIGNGAVDRGLVTLLLTLTGVGSGADPFELERFRGLAPDKVLAACYNSMRNYAFRGDVARRVRYLAGCTDEHGRVNAGYVLRENGCISDVIEDVHYAS